MGNHTKMFQVMCDDKKVMYSPSQATWPIWRPIAVSLAVSQTPAAYTVSVRSQIWDQCITWCACFLARENSPAFVGTRHAYPRRDGQAELTWVTGNIQKCVLICTWKFQFRILESFPIKFYHQKQRLQFQNFVTLLQIHVAYLQSTTRYCQLENGIVSIALSPLHMTKPGVCWSTNSKCFDPS